MDAVAAVITSRDNLYIISESIISLGQGTLLAKIDTQAAYRLIPVQTTILGIEWEGNVYMYCDAMLPFGLGSATDHF